MKNNPKRFFAAAMKNESELELLVYDSIGESWWGDGVTAKSIKAKLDEAGDVNKITVRINSPGGDVFEGSAIYSLLSQHKAEVEMYIDGLAASAAFTVAMAGDKIHISESAMMMCHNAWGMCIGDAREMEKTAEVLQKVSSTMCDIYSKKCGMSAEEVQLLMDAETWMNAADAVEKGFADDVITRTEEEDKEAKALAGSWDLSKMRLKNKPKAEETTEGDEVDPAADAECECDCPECKDGNCAECSDPDCEDPNCEGHEEEPGEASKAAADQAEIARLREEIEILSV